MFILTSMIKLAEVCKKQGNYQGFNIVKAAIDQELKRRNKEDSSILDSILVDIIRRDNE